MKAIEKVIQNPAIAYEYQGNGELEVIWTRFLEEQAKAQAQINEAWEAVEQAMTDAGITKVSGAWGSLTIAERKNWKTERQLPPRFYKQVLDTRRLSAMLEMGDALPAGVDYTTSHYLTKRLK